MRTVVIFSFLNFFLCFYSYGQKVSLNDLTNLCNKTRWEDVNQTLLSKNWTYYDSEKGSTYKYNTITWSFNKDYFSDKAEGWFYLYTYEGLPNKISYSVFNKESYALIQNSLTNAGFKLVNSLIEDNEVISAYANSSYKLTISTEKRVDSDWSDRSTTAYRITLIKKESIYDPDNGKKKDFYYGDVVQAEYTLLNGKLNGKLTVYHENSKVKKTGYYTNGVENGIFKEYDERGNIEAEYSMSNGELQGTLKTYYTNGNLKKSGNYVKGKEDGDFTEYDEDGTKAADYVMANGLKNGVLKIYQNGKIDVSTTFKDDFKNGQRIEYYYNDETGKLELKKIEEFLEDQKNGTWKLFYIENNNTGRLLKFENYIKDVKSGPFQDISGDSLIIGSYKDEKLHGECKIYIDVSRMILGGIISTDISDLNLIAEGSYLANLKSGYWKYYDYTKTLMSEGQYSKGLRTGNWNYYYSKLTNDDGNEVEYSGQLYLVESYLDGKLNGKSTRYSYLEEEEYSCADEEMNNYSSDTCSKMICKKVLKTAYYLNDQLDGPYELLDSNSDLVSKGFYKNGLKESEWLERYIDEGINNEIFFVYQKGNYIKGNREGEWIQYVLKDKISETFNYKNGELHGEYILWNLNDKPQERKQFSSGKLTKLITYDSIGLKPTFMYEIYDQKSVSYKCRRTEYLDSGYTSQEYWVKIEGDINHYLFQLLFELSVVNQYDHTAMYKDGEYKLCNGKNQPIVTGKFFKEDKIGVWISFFYDQNVKIEYRFTNDKVDSEKYLDLNGKLYSGNFIYYDEENEIKEVRKIKDGLRNGNTVYMDLNTDKKIKKESYKNGVLK